MIESKSLAYGLTELWFNRPAFQIIRRLFPLSQRERAGVRENRSSHTKVRNQGGPSFSGRWSALIEYSGFLILAPFQPKFSSRLQVFTAYYSRLQGSAPPGGMYIP